MRILLVISTTAFMVACQRTPEQQQADQLRGAAQERRITLETQAKAQADRLKLQADTLEAEAQKAGGMTGERLRIRADALSKEAKLIQKQADMQADAVEEAADARIKASKSR
jgi:lipopolysaccharide export system protein LptA